jgi:hypothetical protein
MRRQTRPTSHSEAPIFKRLDHDPAPIQIKGGAKRPIHNPFGLVMIAVSELAN